MSGTALVIGAGPAGLTAALELLEHTDYRVLVIESDAVPGGIAKTAVHNGNRIDIGGHRFFSKSDWVMDRWLDLMPLQGKPSNDDVLLGRDVACSDKEGAPDPECEDAVMLVRSRLSRIFYRGKYFDYPISPSFGTLRNLGAGCALRILASYLRYAAFPLREENNLEQFFTNRFGRELYLTFFKDYTEKVWGIPCEDIDASWGAQRVKGLSVMKLITHAMTKPFPSGGLKQKDTETSLIGRFYYPKLGPGQLWELAASRVKERGGEILLRHKVTEIELRDGAIARAAVKNLDNGAVTHVAPRAVFSSMPVKDLIGSIKGNVPSFVKETASALPYRDFITVGVLSRGMRMKNKTTRPSVNNIVPDNWIYIQEPEVRVGRLQIFNNWSPYMVRDPGNVWIGMEYFCGEGDAFWSMDDASLSAFAARELEKLGFVDAESVIDTTVLRVPKAYPAYFGSYRDFGAIKACLDSIANLYCIGRNGTHRYNNMDHSMLSAREAVACLAGRSTKENIWRVNSEDEYHEGR